MSKIKAGDRVRFVTATPLDEQIIAAKVGEIAEVVEVKEYAEFPIRIRFSDAESEWMARSQLRRLVKRKRAKPAAPDRVMVAATVLSGLISRSPQSDHAKLMIPEALRLADALIAEGAK